MENSVKIAATPITYTVFQIDQIFKQDREVKGKRKAKMNRSRHFCYLDILGVL